MKKPLLLLLLICWLPTLSFGQAPLHINEDKISSAITGYFKFDRENIHIHLNKNQFLTTDKIWLKGYITEKKTALPYEPTSNVYVNLLDEKGTKIKSFLFYAENSTFEGSIPLKEQYSTGRYFLQVYTNYMNNFSEDESSVYEIFILNPSENKKVGNIKTIDYSNITTTFTPESGVLLEGVSNTIAIQIKDCHNNGVPVSGGKITDSKGVIIATFATNASGFGKFDLVANHKESYKAVYEINGKTIEKLLPQPQLTGITFSVNNYTFADKTIVKIKTNGRTLADIGDNRYSIVIQKNNTAASLEFAFDNKTEKTLSIPNEMISMGTNTLYLLDNKLAKVGERIIFRPFPYITKTELSVERIKNDSIHIKGLSSLPLAELSISVLPDNALFDNSDQTIYSAKVFADLKHTVPNAAYFLSDFNRKKHYELDNILITSESKYDWRTIMAAVPKENHAFDNGLTIQGTVNTELSDRSDYKVNMTSLVLGFNEFTSIDENNEFQFKNLYVSDSIMIHFSLLNKKAKMKELKMATSVINNNRSFLKPFKPETTLCPVVFETITSQDDQLFPMLLNTNVLDSITIKGTIRKPTLKNDGLQHGNAMSKGYKISQRDTDSFRDVLQFIASHGYDVSTEGGTVRILSRSSVTLHGTKSPAVFMDDMPVNDFSQLQGYSLRFVDEIYINKRGFGGGMESANGNIRIYTKKGIDAIRAMPRIKSGSITIDGGFQPRTAFTTPKYTNFRNAGFQNYATLNWLPKVATDETGAYKFSFPNLYQARIKVIIEGISSDGQLISEIKTIEIPQ